MTKKQQPEQFTAQEACHAANTIAQERTRLGLKESEHIVSDALAKIKSAANRGEYEVRIAISNRYAWSPTANALTKLGYKCFHVYDGGYDGGGMSICWASERA